MRHICTSGYARMRPIGTMQGLAHRMIREIAASSELWNRYQWRTTRSPNSPHREVDDIWVRYNDIKNLDMDNQENFNGPHESVWYPEIEAKLPIVVQFCNMFKDFMHADVLGGVLITRIPPGKQVYWHADTAGWHAKAHRKFLILLRGNDAQTFEFENERMHSNVGDCFEFDNSHLHAVFNPTTQERVSLIVTLRGFKNDR